MIQIAKLGHIALYTTDIDRLLAYYTEVLGFTVTERAGDGTAYLSTDIDHHNVVLSPAAKAGLRHMAFQLAGGASLQDVASHLRRQGIKVASRTDAQPGIAELLEFSDPEGYLVQLYHQTAQMPVASSLAEKPIRPQKLGHLALHAQDVQAMAAFYQTVLGFRVSDWLGDFLVFLRCGPDHHTVNFLRAPGPPRHGMQHLAFQVAAWASIERACDHLAKHHIPLIWGPGRHRMGHNIFTYHRDPERRVVELFTELDLMLNEDLGYFEPRPWHEDIPQRPKVWAPGPDVSDQWGSRLPAEMAE